MSADFSVKITVRNGRLLRAIRAKYGSSAQMCRMCGIPVPALSALLTMRKSPILASGEWSSTAFDISSALDMEPEELWPSHVARIKLIRNEAEIDMSIEDVQDMLQPSRFAAGKALARWSADVQHRDMRALLLAADGATLEEIGGELGISGGRAQQRLKRAYRILKGKAKREGVTSIEDMRLQA